MDKYSLVRQLSYTVIRMDIASQRTRLKALEEVAQIADQINKLEQRINDLKPALKKAAKNAIDLHATKVDVAQAARTTRTTLDLWLKVDSNNGKS